jgi:DNA invertase Pin-like site-specific DNA recombinase
MAKTQFSAMKSIATYRRISKEETARKTDAYIHQGWLLDRKVTDFPGRNRLIFEDMQSGRKDDRPDFLRLIAAIEADKIDTLIVTRIDRISRDLESNARLQKQLQRKGVLVFEILLGRFLDWQNPNDWSYFVQAGLDGEKESRMLSTRVRQTFEFLRSQGKVGGGQVGFPYRRSKEGFIEPNPDNWQLAIDCIKIVIEENGATMTAAIRIRKLGLNRTRQWLYEWIRSPLLRGHTPINTRTESGGRKPHYLVDFVADTHPSLFADPQLKGAQRQLDRIIGDSCKIKGINRSRPTYPLSGLLYCARCGKPCYVKRISNSKYPDKYYLSVVCSQRSNRGISCGGEYGNFRGRRRSINAVYRHVEVEVILALANKAEELIDLELRQSPDDAPEDPAIARLRFEIDRLVSFDDPVLASAIARKSEQINQLLMKNPVANFSVEQRGEFIRMFASGEVLAFASDTEKRQIYQDWVVRVDIDRDEVAVKLTI